MTNEQPPGANLLYNILLFGRLLRRLGLDINPGRMIDVLQALDHVQIGRKSDFYHTMRCLLVHQRDDLPLFDHAFELFWRKPADRAFDDLWGKLGRPQRAAQPRFVPPQLPQATPAPDQPGKADDGADDELLIEVTQTYSRREQLRHKDFAELTAEEMGAIKELMSRLLWDLGRRRTRRQQPGRGRRLDMRRNLRHNLRYGGELLHLARLQPKMKPRPLIVLADISGSMERYARLLIHFLYSLAAGQTQRVELFVFSTRLTRITRQLRNRDVDLALHEVSRVVPDWSGGTRIGDALKSFNYDWGRRVLKGGAVVLIISDGWDRGAPDLLRREMSRLQRSCYRLVWLNPLLGSPEYEPLTRGIQAALPHIDDFLPVHNLASLEDLALHLQRLNVKRPLRYRSWASEK